MDRGHGSDCGLFYWMVDIRRLDMKNDPMGCWTIILAFAAIGGLGFVLMLLGAMG